MYLPNLWSQDDHVCRMPDELWFKLPPSGAQRQRAGVVADLERDRGRKGVCPAVGNNRLIVILMLKPAVFRIQKRLLSLRENSICHRILQVYYYLQQKYPTQRYEIFPSNSVPGISGISLCSMFQLLGFGALVSKFILTFVKSLIQSNSPLRLVSTPQISKTMTHSACYLMSCTYTVN